MYDEYEQAVTGRPGRTGMSPLGWLVAGMGFFVLVGVVGAGFAVSRAVGKAKDVAWDVARGLDAAKANAALAQLDAHSAMVLSLDPAAGLAYLQDLGSGDPGEAFVARMGAGALEPFRELKALGRVGAVAGERRGDGTRGNVRISLDRHAGGGALVIDADGEQVRFDVVRTQGGGSLRITSADGDVRFDVSGGDRGGRLLIESDEATVRLGVGGEASSVPGWVPVFPGAGPGAQPVLSLESEAGVLGAVAWEDAAEPGDVLAFYRAELEGQGYALEQQVRRTAGDVDEGSLWARRESDGRMVFLVARQEAGRTEALLGFGEAR